MYLLTSPDQVETGGYFLLKNFTKQAISKSVIEIIKEICLDISTCIMFFCVARQNKLTCEFMYQAGLGQ